MHSAHWPRINIELKQIIKQSILPSNVNILLVFFAPVCILKAKLVNDLTRIPKYN